MALAAAGAALPLLETGIKVVTNVVKEISGRIKQHQQEHRIKKVESEVMYTTGPQFQFEGALYLRTRVLLGEGDKTHKELVDECPIAYITTPTNITQQLESAGVKSFVEGRQNRLNELVGKKVNNGMLIHKHRYSIHRISQKLDECLLFPLLDHFSNLNVSQSDLLPLKTNANAQQSVQRCLLNHANAAAARVNSLISVYPSANKRITAIATEEELQLARPLVVPEQLKEVLSSETHRPHTFKFFMRGAVNITLELDTGKVDKRSLFQRLFPSRVAPPAPPAPVVYVATTYVHPADRPFLPLAQTVQHNVPLVQPPQQNAPLAHVVQQHAPLVQPIQQHDPLVQPAQQNPLLTHQVQQNALLAQPVQQNAPLVQPHPPVIAHNNTPILPSMQQQKLLDDSSFVPPLGTGGM